MIFKIRFIEVQYLINIKYYPILNIVQIMTFIGQDEIKNISFTHLEGRY